MKVKVTIVKDNGEEIEISRTIGELDSMNILNSVESEVSRLQEAMTPFISEKLIAAHQECFEGKKNQEEKRNA